MLRAFVFSVFRRRLGSFSLKELNKMTCVGNADIVPNGIYRDIWTIDFSDPEEPLKNRTVCNCFRPEKPRLIIRKRD